VYLIDGNFFLHLYLFLPAPLYSSKISKLPFTILGISRIVIHKQRVFPNSEEKKNHFRTPFPEHIFFYFRIDKSRIHRTCSGKDVPKIISEKIIQKSFFKGAK